MPLAMHPDEVPTDEALVAQLITAQFARGRGLPITPVRSSGTDNAMYRLGEHWVVRLPRVPSAAAQVDKEHRFLPRLAPALPLAVPTPIALGAPGAGYPYPWS